jgi:hypothetical protein
MFYKKNSNMQIKMIHNKNEGRKCYPIPLQNPICKKNIEKFEVPSSCPNLN